MAILPLQLARVSSLLKTSVATGTIARTQQSLLGVQNQLSTGKRLSAPSDDPGAAAVAQQLRKTLEKREAYAANLRHAAGHLGAVDTTLADLSDLLRETQTIASANVGSDITSQEREGAAAVVGSLYSQLLSLANRQHEGTYLFGGDKAADRPFVEGAGGVKFVGSDTVLQNAYDDSTVLPFMVDGSRVFGALSSEVRGAADLTPAVTPATRLADLRGALGAGVGRGSIRVDDGAGTAKVIDLTAADSVQDVVTAINGAGVGAVMAAVSLAGDGITLSAGAGDDITVTDTAGGTTALDLGILTPGGAGAGTPIVGAPLAPRVTMLTNLADLRNGAGVDPAGLVLTNGAASRTVTLAGLTTVQDLVNAVASSGTGAALRVNAAGTGLDLLNPVQGPGMTVGENGGTTAADLGVRSLAGATPLAGLNGGKGVRTVATGADLRVTRTDGTTFDVELSGALTVGDAIAAINAADGGAGVTAGLATTGNGIVLTDATGGAGALSVANQNAAHAVEDLGLTAAPAGATLAGTDVNPVTAGGAFANLARLRDALRADDSDEITAAAEGLRADLDRAIAVRGEAGARAKELEARKDRLDDQNVATKAMLSGLEDTDFTDAIMRFETLQQSLQATYQTTAKLLDQSLLDFIG